MFAAVDVVFGCACRYRSKYEKELRVWDTDWDAEEHRQQQLVQQQQQLLVKEDEDKEKQSAASTEKTETDTQPETDVSKQVRIFRSC